MKSLALGALIATLLSAQQDRLENWRLLQDLAGIK